MSGLDDLLAQKEAEIQELKAKLARAGTFFFGDVQTIIDTGIEEPLHEEDLSLLIFDIADSTKTAEKYKQAGLTDILLDARLELFNDIDTILTKRGLKTWKSLGDAMYNYATGQHKETQTILAAAELVKLMHEKYANYELTAPPGVTIPEELKKPNLRIRIGAAKGRAQKGVDQVGDKKVYDVNGPTVNLTARCESNAGYRQALISEELHETLKQRAITLPSKIIDAKGITTDGQENKAKVYEIDHETAKKILRQLNTHDTTHIIQKQTPLFGRQQELAQILTNTATLTITGEPGIGRTRLLQEARKQQPGHYLNATPIDQSPFQPFIEYFKTNHYDIGEHNSTIRKLLGQEPIQPEEQGKQFSDKIKQAIQAHFAAHPEPIYVDDAQWLDAQTRDTLTKLQNPKVITTTDKADITLQPLEEEAIREYVAHLTTKIPPELQQQYAQLIAQAKGNPLFIQLIAEELNEHYKQHTTLPTTVKANIKEQLEHQYNTLDQELQNALRIIATTRGEADPRLIETILKKPVKWEELQKRSIITPTPTGYTLQRPALAEVINRTIRSKDKQQLHQLILAATTDTKPATLAYHHEHAGNTQQAIQHLRAAAEEDMKLYGREEATKKLEHALYDLMEEGRYGDEERAEKLERMLEEGKIDFQKANTMLEILRQMIRIHDTLSPELESLVEIQGQYLQIMSKLSEAEKERLNEELRSLERSVSLQKAALFTNKGHLAGTENHEQSFKYTADAVTEARKSGDLILQDKAFANYQNVRIIAMKNGHSVNLSDLIKESKAYLDSRNGGINLAQDKSIRFNLLVASLIDGFSGKPLDESTTSQLIKEIEDWHGSKDSVMKNDLYKSVLQFPPIFRYTIGSAQMLMPILENGLEIEKLPDTLRRRGDNNRSVVFYLLGLAHINLALSRFEKANEYINLVRKTNYWQYVEEDVRKLCNNYASSIQI